MMQLGPMLQQPVLKTALWGGRKLAELFGKQLPPGQRIGESWEVADHPSGTSLVASGPLRGWSLRQVANDYPEELFGPGAPPEWRERFPLLIKLLDAEADLSIQVHPDADYITRHQVADSAKTEAWVILHAAPGARLITGIQPGVRREEFRSAALAGRLEPLLVSREVRPGEVVFVPAGCLHAIRAGIVLAEFQQTSGTTYRVYDWGRRDESSRPRDLHLDQALECLKFGEELPPPGGRGIILDRAGTKVESLVVCDKFYVERASLGGEWLRRTLERGFECVTIIQGQGEIMIDGEGGPPLPLKMGETAIVPACAGAYKLRGDPASTAATPPATLTALLSGVPICGAMK